MNNISLQQTYLSGRQKIDSSLIPEEAKKGLFTSNQVNKRAHFENVLKYAQIKYANNPSGAAHSWITECLSAREAPVPSEEVQLRSLQQLAHNDRGSFTSLFTKTPAFPRGFLKALTIGYIIEKGEEAFIYENGISKFNVENFISQITTLSGITEDSVNYLTQNISKDKKYIANIELKGSKVYFGENGYTNSLELANTSLRVNRTPQIGRKRLRERARFEEELLPSQETKRAYLTKTITYAKKIYADMNSRPEKIAQDWVIKCLQHRAGTMPDRGCSSSSLAQLAKNDCGKIAHYFTKTPAFPRGFLKALTIGFIMENGMSAFKESDLTFNTDKFLKEIGKLRNNLLMYKLTMEDVNFLINEIRKNKDYIANIYVEERLGQNTLVHFGEDGYTNKVKLGDLSRAAAYTSDNLVAPQLSPDAPQELDAPSKLSISNKRKNQIDKQKVSIKALSSRFNELEKVNALSVTNLMKIATEAFEMASISGTIYTTPALRKEAFAIIKICYKKFIEMPIEIINKIEHIQSQSLSNSTTLVIEDLIGIIPIILDNQQLRDIVQASIPQINTTILGDPNLLAEKLINNPLILTGLLKIILKETICQFQAILVADQQLRDIVQASIPQINTTILGDPNLLAEKLINNPLILTGLLKIIVEKQLQELMQLQSQLVTKYRDFVPPWSIESQLYDGTITAKTAKAKFKVQVELIA